MLAMLPALSAAALAAGSWEPEPDTNAVYSRLANGPGKDSGDVKFLGTLPTFEACVAAATKAAEESPTKFNSLAWHGHLAGPYHRQCYGVTGTEWAPHRQKGVTSAKGPRATPSPPPPPPGPPPGPAVPCASPADCNYNGVCEGAADAAAGARACKCAPQFAGASCEKFAFAPLDLSKGTGLRTVDPTTGQQVSSWGGSVHLAADGLYHMWAAEMTGSVGIKAWITNSQVVHAVASHPTAKPFEFVRKEVVSPVFAHEPTVSRAPTGEWVMFYTSNHGEKPGSQCNPPCGCGNNGSSCESCPNDQVRASQVCFFFAC
jgi:hypothetical protein